MLKASRGLPGHALAPIFRDCPVSVAQIMPGLSSCCRLAIFLIAVLTPALHRARGQVVLQDLSRIPEAQVVRFDRYEVELSTGQRLSWDQILSATVESPEQQEALDQRLKQWGLPLARLKQRLRFGDPAGAGRLAVAMLEAEPITPPGDPPESTSQAAIDARFLLSAAAMLQQLRVGQRERALVHWLDCLYWHGSATGQIRHLARSLLPPDDGFQTGYWDRLPPVWFDAMEVESVYSVARQRYDSAFANRDPRLPGVELYLASLEIQLDQPESARQQLTICESRGSGGLRSLEQAIEGVGMRYRSEFEPKSLPSVPRLNGQHPSIETVLGLDAFYDVWLERQAPAAASEASQTTQLLGLLQQVAVRAEASPHLAAAALDRARQVAERLGDAETAEKLSAELLRSFPETYHARQHQLTHGR